MDVGLALLVMLPFVGVSIAAAIVVAGILSQPD